MQFDIHSIRQSIRISELQVNGIRILLISIGFALQVEVNIQIQVQGHVHLQAQVHVQVHAQVKVLVQVCVYL